MQKKRSLCQEGGCGRGLVKGVKCYRGGEADVREQMKGKKHGLSKARRFRYQEPGIWKSRGHYKGRGKRNNNAGENFKKTSHGLDCD